MTDDPKPAFEFDPLPGDPNAPASEKPLAKDKKKTERKKRGPRRVVVPPGSNAMAEAQAGTKAAVDAALGRVAKSERKKHTSKPERPPEFSFIKQFMELTEATRKRVLAALNEIFS